MRFNGVYGETWSGWFDGLTMTPRDDDTLLTGPMRDQAALHGLLARIGIRACPCCRSYELETNTVGPTSQLNSSKEGVTR